MGLRMKNYGLVLCIMGVYRKIQFLGGGRCMKNQYIGGKMSKKGGLAGVKLGRGGGKAFYALFWKSKKSALILEKRL